MKARTKLLLLLLPPLVLGSLFINHFAGRAVYYTLQEKAAEAARAGAASVIESSDEAFASRKEPALLPVLFSLKTALNASEAAYADTAGTVLAHTDVAKKGRSLQAGLEKFLSPDGGYFMEPLPAGGRLHVFIPVFEPAPRDPEELSLMDAASGKHVGTLIVAIPAAPVISAAVGISRRISLILLIVNGVVLLAVFLTTGVALRPVRLLTEGTRSIRRGDYGALIPVDSRDEFGDLARSFNDMSRTLAGTIVSRNYVDAIVDSIADILLVTDLDFRIVRVNKAARAALGRDEKALLGLPLLSLFSAEADAGGGFARRLSGEGEVRDLEALLLAPAPVPVQLSASYIKDNDGSRSGIVVLARDITLRKKYESELARSNEDLQRFAFVASHDLQEPLRTISSYIQLLESKYSKELGPEAGGHVVFVTGAVKRMRALVRDLLEYSKINAQLKLEPVDAGEALDSVLDLLQDAISSAGAVVERGPLPVVNADRGHIERLLQNLLANAIKFRDGRKPLVRVAAARRDDGWVFSVSDNGEGIDPRYAGKIFKLFGRLHGAATEGAGIGLASCRKILDQYGGRIWFESEPGKGSTFSFFLPGKPLPR